MHENVAYMNIYNCGHWWCDGLVTRWTAVGTATPVLGVRHDVPYLWMSGVDFKNRNGLSGQSRHARADSAKKSARED